MERSAPCVLGFIVLNILLCWGYSQDSVLTIEPNWSTLFTGESVNFTCDMREGDEDDWYYSILKDGLYVLQDTAKKKSTLQPLAAGDSGEYQCSGTDKRTSQRTKMSNKVSLTVSDADVILQQPASILYAGESVSVRCRHRNQTKTKGASFYRNGFLIERKTTSTITLQPLVDWYLYMCKFDDGKKSKTVTLNLEGNRPKAYLSKDKPHVTAGVNVTLTCSVAGPSSGWRYFWYRGSKTRKPMTTGEAVFLSNEQISVSQGGVYWCRGGRGNPLYYTKYSSSVVTSRAVVTLLTSWPEIYSGETITLSCEIEEGEDTEWEYDWWLSSSFLSRINENTIRWRPSSIIEYYVCLGRVKGGGDSTELSETFGMTISTTAPQAVLSASASWLSSGDSVTLTCRVKNPAAGWRYYWYKILPELPGSYYRFELLPGSSNGTEQDSLTVGPAFTSGYRCRAGRGSPLYLTHYSDSTFVWSGEMNSEASLTVSPDRTQHLLTESVSLSCDGNSTEWRVTKWTSYTSHCSSWGTMTGSTCSVQKSKYTEGVYWCESATGLFSNAVNITNQNSNIILMSPVRPVAEGNSVTLGCKLEKENSLAGARFYKNDQLVQDDGRKELTIDAATKSVEGFYKCGRNDSALRSWTSAESWMSVKSMPGPRSSPVVLIVGLVSGLLFILLLLLLLYHYRKSKGPCCISSRRNNRGSAANIMTRQDGTPHIDASPLQDPSCEVPYSSVMITNITRKEKMELEERTIYVDVKTGSAAGNSSPEATYETVYSEVNAGAVFGR